MLVEFPREQGSRVEAEAWWFPWDSVVRVDPRCQVSKGKCKRHTIESYRLDAIAGRLPGAGTAAIHLLLLALRGVPVGPSART